MTGTVNPERLGFDGCEGVGWGFTRSPDALASSLLSCFPSCLHSLKPSQPVGLGVSHLTRRCPSPWPGRLPASRKQTTPGNDDALWGKRHWSVAIGLGFVPPALGLQLALLPIAGELAMAVSGGGLEGTLVGRLTHQRSARVWGLAPLFLQPMSSWMS